MASTTDTNGVRWAIRGSSLERRLAVVSVALALAAMAVDHLMGDDPGLEDPPMFAIACGLSLALAALLFGRVVPAVSGAAEPARRAARDGLLCSTLAVFPGITTLWLGLPFVLAGCGLALGVTARQQGERGLRANAAIAIGALALVGATTAYAVQAIDKLS